MAICVDVLLVDNIHPSVSDEELHVVLDPLRYVEYSGRMSLHKPYSPLKHLAEGCRVEDEIVRAGQLPNFVLGP